MKLVSLLDEAFEISSSFDNPKLGNYFLEAMYGEVERVNAKERAADFLVFKRQFTARLAQQKAATPSAGGQAIHQKTLALYCFYREAKEGLPEMKGKSRKEIAAYFANQHGLSAGKFRQVLSAMKDKEKRLTRENIPHMESALFLLDGYPKAKEYAEDELKTLKNRP